jgi:acyl-CoA reductase-like NAD-dependent aldehyde dehydrogenase
MVDWIQKSQAITINPRNLIEGRWSTIGGTGHDKRAPRDGKTICRIGDGDVHEVERAVVSARRAFEEGRWSSLPLRSRQDILYKLATLIERHCEELALLESMDVGKPIGDALRFDVPAAAGIIKASAESADKVFGKVFSTDQSNLSYQLRRPIGVVAGIVGWNFPLVLAAGKVGPVLATGNSLVLKPSELTSFSAGRLAELALEAGVPAGVFNVVHGGPAIGDALAHHRNVDLVTFTGSTRTGKSLLIASGNSNMKRLLLECGGKAPNIVFEDSPDLNAVADAVVARAFWNQGQVCTASSRLLVQSSIKEYLMPLILERVAGLLPGDPLQPDTKFGAVVSEHHKEKVLKYVSLGEREGARKLYQSAIRGPYDEGFYVAPVIFDNVSPQQQIAREEIFGPVLSVLTFSTEKEAIRLANDTIYGLSAILWTKDLGRAHRTSQGIKAGWITVNATATPTGGPAEGVLSVGGLKESGLGTEGGIEGLEAYMSTTAVQFFV